MIHTASHESEAGTSTTRFISRQSAAALPRYFRPRFSRRFRGRRRPQPPDTALYFQCGCGRAKVAPHASFPCGGRSRSPWSGASNAWRTSMGRGQCRGPTETQVAHTVASSRADQDRSALGRGIGPASSRLLEGIRPQPASSPRLTRNEPADRSSSDCSHHALSSSSSWGESMAYRSLRPLPCSTRISIRFESISLTRSITISPALRPAP